MHPGEDEPGKIREAWIGVAILAALILGSLPSREGVGGWGPSW